MAGTLAELLAAADAEEYAVHFRREGFRSVREVLDAGMTQRDLDQMGITNAEARNRIVRELFRTNSAAGSQGEQAPEDDTLSLWLSELGVRQLCVHLFRKEGFDSLQEVIDARLTEDDLQDLGLETMKSRKAVLKSLAALTSEAATKPGTVGLGAAAEATFVESYHRHRRLSSGSLTSTRRDSFHSAAGFSESGSDGEFAASDDDGGDNPSFNGRSPQIEEGLIRAIGVLPAGDLQAHLLPPPSATQAEMLEDEVQNAGHGERRVARNPNKCRVALVAVFPLVICTAFFLLWFASYGFNLQELIEQEVKGYEVGRSLLDLAVLLLFACTSLLAAGSLGCSIQVNGACRRAATGATTAAVLVLPALGIGM